VASTQLPPAFDLNLLRALERLLATRSVSAAARSLGVGQPAMSKTLQRLRGELGDPLLVRVGHAMVPTPRGAALAEPVGAALAAAGRVLARPEAFDPKTARGQFVLAMPEHAHTTVAVPFIERLEAAAPGLDLRIRTLTFASRVELARGDLHLAIVPDLSALPNLPKPDLSEFVVRPLYREEYAVVSARKRRPLRWTLDRYASARHVLVATLGENDVGVVDPFLEKLGMRRRVAVTVPGFLQAARLVASTDLVATLPERVAHTTGYPLDIQRPPLELPELRMLVGWHPRDTNDPRHRWLREQLATCVV
jgi:DNA-binding transcriptional LysR family regulator